MAAPDSTSINLSTLDTISELSIAVQPHQHCVALPIGLIVVERGRKLARVRWFPSNSVRFREDEHNFATRYLGRTLGN